MLPQLVPFFSSTGWRPESDKFFLYFSLCSMVWRISVSTSARFLEYFSRELRTMLSKLSCGVLGILRVVAEKAGAFSPLMIIEITKCRLFIWSKSWASKVGSNCFDNRGASSAETRKEMVVPTLPNTASRTDSVI